MRPLLSGAGPSEINARADFGEEFGLAHVGRRHVLKDFQPESGGSGRFLCRVGNMAFPVAPCSSAYLVRIRQEWWHYSERVTGGGTFRAALGYQAIARDQDRWCPAHGRTIEVRNRHRAR